MWRRGYMPSASPTGEPGCRRWSCYRRWRWWVWRHSFFRLPLLSALGAQQVSLPIFNPPLYRFAVVQPFVQHLPCKGHQFLISSKPERNQLRRGELRDSRAQIHWQQALQPQAHLQTNHAVLHREREQTGVKNENQEGDGEQHVHDGSERNPVL